MRADQSTPYFFLLIEPVSHQPRFDGPPLWGNFTRNASMVCDCARFLLILACLIFLKQCTIFEKSGCCNRILNTQPKPPAPSSNEVCIHHECPAAYRSCMRAPINVHSTYAHSAVKLDAALVRKLPLESRSTSSVPHQISNGGQGGCVKEHSAALCSHFTLRSHERWV